MPTSGYSEDSAIRFDYLFCNTIHGCAYHGRFDEAGTIDNL